MTVPIWMRCARVVSPLRASGRARASSRARASGRARGRRSQDPDAPGKRCRDRPARHGDGNPGQTTRPCWQRMTIWPL